MKRFISPAALVLVLAALALPAVAIAKIVELGATKTGVTAPVCPPSTVKHPQQCTIILTRSTALETMRDGIAFPTKATHAGEIVAFTLGISALSSNRKTRKQYIHNLDQAYGGVTLAAVTVLKQVGSASNLRWEVVAESPYIHLEPYLGQVVQFPLQTNLPIARGEVVAITTPTWAPILTIDVSPKSFAYRQSRSANCGNPPATQQAQTTPGSVTSYKCLYDGTRPEYTATEVLSPVPPKNYVHAGDRG